MREEKYVAVLKNKKHQVLKSIGPFIEAEDAARYIHAQPTSGSDYWIVTCLFAPCPGERIESAFHYG